jgi:predicted MPP superfamily phosphohydrolase
MMNPVRILILLLLYLPLTSFATTIKGYVFIDKNGNGVRDKNESGIKDVVVSDQVATTTTNAEGFYQFESSQNFGFLFISQPSGFATKGLFWKPIPKNQIEVTYDFALYPIPTSSKFTFIHASDTHISESSIDRIQKLRQKADSLKPAFVLMSGDLIKDALRVSEKEASRLYELYVAETNKFSVPVYSVPGNHEIFGIERHSSLVSTSHPLYGKVMYRQYLGPDYYSFNYGGVHFVGVNSVDYNDLWYYGFVDTVQLKWIEKDISTLQKSTPIVTFNHIPFYTGGLSMWGYQDEEPGSTLILINGQKYFRHVVNNADAAMSILKNTSYTLALSGHYHASQQFTIEGVGKTRFHQTGAIVGPSRLGSFVLPSGFTVYSAENGKIDNGKFIDLD